MINGKGAALKKLLSCRSEPGQIFTFEMFRDQSRVLPQLWQAAIKHSAISCQLAVKEWAGGKLYLCHFRDQTSLFPIQIALTSCILQFEFITISKQKIQDLKAPKNNHSIFDLQSIIVSGKGQLSVRLPTCIGSTHCLMLVPTAAASFRQKLAFLSLRMLGHIGLWSGRSNS